MDGGNFNVKEVIRQLGFKSVHEMPVTAVIQPTLIVGDASAITPPLMPATAFVGGYTVGNAATTYGGIQIVAGPDGTWVRAILITPTSAIITLNFGVLSPPTPTAIAIPVVKNEMGPVGTRCLALNVDILVADAPSNIDMPRTSCGANTPRWLNDMIFVPPGHAFEAYSRSLSNGFAWLATVQDVAAPNLSPTG